MRGRPYSLGFVMEARAVTDRVVLEARRPNATNGSQRVSVTPADGLWRL